MSGVFCPDATVRARVASLAGVGLPAFQIAYEIQVSVTTLQVFYGDVMMAAQARQNYAVLEALAKMARSGRSVAATLFWVKSRCGGFVTTAGTAAGMGFETGRMLVITGPNGERA